MRRFQAGLPAVSLLALSWLWLAAARAPQEAPDAGRFAAERRQMVETQIRQRGVTDPRVLRAMEEVPRHLFVPESLWEDAYADRPLALGGGQTIYQPYVVALMTSLLDLDASDRVLEIGTGTGYHTAILSRVAAEVYSIEILEPRAQAARKRLQELGYQNVHIRVGDGSKGWPEEAPFDAIILTAAPPKIPQALIDQLAVGGKMVAPVGEFFQDLQVVTKTADGLEKKTVIPVRLSPMTGDVQREGN